MHSFRNISSMIHEKIYNLLYSQSPYKKEQLIVIETLPVSPFVTTLQFTTLGSTALRSSRKKIPFERFLSYTRLSLTKEEKRFRKPTGGLKLIAIQDYSWLFTLKLSIWEVLLAFFTLLFAQFRMSASVISFPFLPWEWDLKFLKSWSIENLINCHKYAGEDTKGGQLIDYRTNRGKKERTLWSSYISLGKSFWKKKKKRLTCSC